MKITRVNCSTSELDESQLRTVPGNIMLVTYRLLNSVYARALARYLAGSSLPSRLFRAPIGAAARVTIVRGDSKAVPKATTEEKCVNRCEIRV